MLQIHMFATKNYLICLKYRDFRTHKIKNINYEFANAFKIAPSSPAAQK